MLPSCSVSMLCILLYCYRKLMTFRVSVCGRCSYLQVEWDVKKKEKEGDRKFTAETMKGCNPKCPQQTNFSDCGIYVLQYVESFFKVMQIELERERERENKEKKAG